MQKLIEQTVRNFVNALTEVQEAGLRAAWAEYFPKRQPTARAIEESGMALVQDGNMTDGLRFWVVLPLKADPGKLVRVSALVEFKIGIADGIRSTDGKVEGGSITWSFTQVAPKVPRDELEKQVAIELEQER